MGIDATLPSWDSLNIKEDGAPQLCLLVYKTPLTIVYYGYIQLHLP